MNVAPHLFWITSRAAGGAALLLASASVAVGLMMSSKRKDSNKRDLRAIHEALSLTTLAMVALHGLSLLGDSFLHPGLSGIAIPFVGAYRPLWTGIGIIAGYGLAVLGLTYYLRDRIGAARWRRLHRLTARLLAARDRPHDRGRKRRGPALVLGDWRRGGHPGRPSSHLALARTSGGQRLGEGQGRRSGASLRSIFHPEPGEMSALTRASGR